MASRRIVYGAALLAALAFQIFYDGYLAQFLLVCVIALPLLSLLLSFPGILRLRLGLNPSAPRLTRGEKGEWRVSVKTSPVLSVSSLTLRLTIQNSLTGEEVRERLRVSGLTGSTSRVFPMECGHCGVLTCGLDRARALDLLGLFAFPVPLPRPAQAIVLPGSVPPEELPDLTCMFAGIGGDVGQGRASEDYELREYRPGDPLRSIHWKLSSKYDGLVVREPLKSGHPQAVLTFDLFGTPERLDLVLARLWTASLVLIRQEIPHKVLWLDLDGQRQEAVVASQAQLLDGMTRILSRRAPAEPPQALLDLSDLPGVPRLHITSGEEDTP